MNNASGAIHGHHCIYSSNTGVGAIMGVRDRVEEGLWRSLNWFLWEFLVHQGHWRCMWPHS
jgi:hypothetical protein